MTGGTNGVMSSNGAPAGGSQGGGINRIFGSGPDDGRRGDSGLSSSFKPPAEGYTKESFIELTKSVNLFGGGGPKKLREMLAIQESLAQQDVRALVDELMADKSQESQQALYFAMGVLAEQSPMEALDLVLAQQGSQQLGYGVYQAVAASMEKDPEGTLARVQTIENKMVRQRAMSSAINTLAMKNPEKALDIYLNSDMSGQNDYSLHTIFNQLAQKDHGMAAAALDKIQDDQKRMRAMSGLLSSWLREDPAGAWEWAQKQPLAGQTHQDARYQALTTWAQSDPEAALQAAQALPDRVRQQTLPQIIGSWARQDPEAALSWITSSDNPTVMENAFRNISYSDGVEPKRLFDLVMEKMPAGNAFRNTVSQVVSRWAQKDPQAAAAALETLPPGDAFNNSAGNLVRQWSKKDPAAAFNWVKSLPEGSGRNDTIRNWFNTVAGDQPNLAETYYRKLSLDEQNRVASSIASSLVASDPAAAIQFSATVADEKTRQRTQESIARSWARQNPQQAARWAASLPQEQKSRAIRNVVDSWADKNVEAAAEWLASMPADQSLDEATRSLTRRLVGVDPEAAMSWAGSIVEEKDRQRAVIDSARQWIRNDPASGKAWVQRSGLSQEQKDKLLN